MRKGFFSIDGSLKENEVFEGWTDGSTWNGWANIEFTKEQLQAYLEANAGTFRFLGPHEAWNDRDHSICILYGESQGNGNTDGETMLEGYQSELDWTLTEVFSMNGYCFVEVEKLEDGYKEKE